VVAIAADETSVPGSASEFAPNEFEKVVADDATENGTIRSRRRARGLEAEVCAKSIATFSFATGCGAGNSFWARRTLDIPSRNSATADNLFIISLAGVDPQGSG